MKRVVMILVLIPVLFMIMGGESSALTFEFNKGKPGVQAFAVKYLRFTVGGETIIPALPANFYVIYDSADDIPVLVAKVGKLNKTSRISPYLEELSGGRNAKVVAGPQGGKVVYNATKPPHWKVLSSYALWDGWVFIGGRKETIVDLLKRHKNTAEIVKADKSVSATIKEWKNAGVRVWGDNVNDRLSNLFEAQKKRILIPLIRDPKKIKYIAGAFTLTEAKEMSGTLLIRPSGQQAGKEIEGDLGFIGETIRRRLVAVKTPYKGKVYSTDNGVVYETYIGNYLAAQGQIVREER